MNFESQPLQAHEIEAMKADPEIIRRIVESYKLMLDFYGMKLASLDTGLVQRATPPRNYENRYRNLVRECCSSISYIVLGAEPLSFQDPRTTIFVYPES
jgi:Opioid growth factor receptor (OGFr) conserved region